jgi:hypothetical protein
MPQAIFTALYSFNDTNIKYNNETTSISLTSKPHQEIRQEEPK